MIRRPGRHGRAWLTRVAAGLLLLGNLPDAIGGAAATEVHRLPFGPRFIALGGAGVSVSEELSSIYWNPAGLASLDHQEVGGSHVNLFQSGLRVDQLGLAVPISQGRTLSLGWYHSGYDDDALTFAENQFELAGGVRIHPKLAAGGVVRYLTRSLDEDGIDAGRGHGIGFDLALRAPLSERLRVAVSAQDIGDTRLDYDDSGSAPTYAQVLRAGADWQPVTGTRLALQVDDQWHLGGEWNPIPAVALRAGLRQAFEAPEDPIWSVGTGLTVSGLRFDYAREMHPTLNDTQYFSLTAGFQFNPSLLSIEELTVDDLYVSQLRSYSVDAPAAALIRNRSDEPIEAVLTLEIPGLTREAAGTTVLLRPGVTTRVPLPILIDDRAAVESVDRPVSARVTARYSGRRLERRESRTTRTVAYGSGAIDWDRGVEQAAAFVTPRDPVIDAWARQVLLSVGAADSAQLGSPQLAGMAALFNALCRLGLRYVPDQLNPYAGLHDAGRVVDTIHYPRQTLASRTGDCDDTSVLLATLLHNVGIETRLVDLPGHLMVLADAGIHPRYRRLLDPAGDRCVEIDDRLWIPIESTALGGDFLGAWAEGAGLYQAESSRGRARVVDLLAAQRRYPPADLGNGSPVAIPPAAQLAADLERTRSGLRIDSSRVPGPPDILPATAMDPAVRNELARMEWRAGRLEDARLRLSGLSHSDPRWRVVRAHNLALVEASAGQAEAARRALADLDTSAADDPDIARLREFLTGGSAGNPGTIPSTIRWKD